MLRWILVVALVLTPRAVPAPVDERPNILFAIADDWGWPHAGAYGDPVVATPTFDRLAREGVLFEHAYVSSPSCTPSRNAILTGQAFWRLAEGANLHSTLDAAQPVYPLLLEAAGYHIGHWRKSFGPGRLAPGGWADAHPAGRKYDGFESFLAARPDGAPFCFWLGASDPHRGYDPGSGARSGMELEDIEVPPFFPDLPAVRSDIADYYFEVQRFDADVAAALAVLEQLGELENTLVVMTGDHGMPFPRCKSNIYDMGVHVPLALRFGARIAPARRLTDFVSLTDLAPTFLEAAGLTPPEAMTGRSLMPLLAATESGRLDPARDHVTFGKERHVPSQARPSMAGYPCRGIRTDDWLYIQNFAPARGPAGIADAEQTPMGWAFSDCDDGPTKTAILGLQDDPVGQRFFALAFGLRPAEELYDLRADPHQLVNLAGEPRFDARKQRLSAALTAELESTGDPRAVGDGEEFDSYPYYGRSRR
jgi:N-sulfoglucosamine sulfohydrolase